MTQMTKAINGEISKEMRMAAAEEGVAAEFICQGIAAGTIVIPANVNHKNLKAKAFGRGLKTKVNANFGTSEDYDSIEAELKKLEAAVKAGADAVMDLSTGDKIKETRAAILKNAEVPVGTVPIYQAAVETVKSGRGIIEMKVEELFEVIKAQVEEGVDFITVHCGLTLETLRHLAAEGRVTDIVSRGGSFMAAWMLHNNQENPLFEYYDRLLEICYKNDVTLSLGDALRPGSLADATDRAQIHELLVLGELVDRAREAEVQVMVEGPGHVPYDQIETNIKLQKELCKEAPFYVLGPLVTDIAAGYDHITAAIGGTAAAAAGADFLCYVTPAEHIGLPDIEDVREGVIACKIAAHAADIAKGVKGAKERDNQMAAARKKLDWEKQIELALAPEKLKESRAAHNQTLKEEDACTMCGSYCAMKIVDQQLS
ncbi:MULTISPECIES: phosphomethylpyrimidine synthase ThiC [Halanaerobium]|jgi:phosphomethylpyrimidine synthase|uniref:Phosphomethylpyrimidine synthase n=2 Tax=Halanaerobium TaxID=2330 RepID=A0A1M7IC24_9FIRM|nr:MULTISPECIES: phosphomethylpyrimidine synthase ThiC [Halanaerobium]KXS48353.1 MAG: thiamine biosynthesis protein ThiC [Halanaerobium sp. T82-1]OEG62796.1 MAG: phosphomethylpyrimidine synthase [Halanaerobium sp. MDAL1]PUU86728.1 MAG: thiamine biosynthesis protein ThiC [Halanaerobium sp.]PUU90424.1 MAG: thiamine biosynthesis protein ThiC [Halanaerobium sp.]PXV65369.1 phosphomethylpyrimidine synthase [Halanaerobium congolense]